MLGGGPAEAFKRAPCDGRRLERVLKIARSGDLAYKGAAIASFPVGRVPSRGALVYF